MRIPLYHFLICLLVALASQGCRDEHAHTGQVHWTYPDADGKHRSIQVWGNSSQPDAVVIAVHGGAWMDGKPEDCYRWFSWLLDESTALVAPSFRQSPEAPYPAALQDLERAFEAILARWPQSRHYVLGYSSGAHLGAWVSAKVNRRLEKQTITGMVGIFGIYNLESLAQQSSKVDLLAPDSFVSSFLGPKWWTDPELSKTASPIHQIDGDSPDFLLIHGLIDDIISEAQSQEMFQAVLKLPSLHVDCIWLPKAKHRLDEILQEKVKRAIKDFVTP